MTNSFTWMIGGPQGSGINSVAENFAKACIRGGLHVFANIEYHSNIKGEHSYYRLRVDSRELRSHVDWVDLLVALDKTSTKCIPLIEVTATRSAQEAGSSTIRASNCNLKHSEEMTSSSFQYRTWTF